MDKAIKATVIGHLFGDESSLLNVSIDTTVREDQTEPGTLLLIKINSKKLYNFDSTNIHIAFYVALLTFSMLSNIVKSISQPTDVFSNFFPCFLNF